MRRLAISMILAMGPALVMAMVFVWPDFRMWRAGVPVDGEVTRLEPAQHRSVYYRYEYAGSLFEYGAQGGAGIGNPSFDSLRPGSKIMLWVVPTQPEKALPGDPGPPLRSNVAFVVVAYAVLVFFAYRNSERLAALVGR